MTSSQARFDLITFRCGKPTAGLWLLDRVIRTYRRVVLARHPRWRKPGTSPTHTLYRRRLIEAYLAAKRVLR